MRSDVAAQPEAGQAIPIRTPEEDAILALEAELGSLDVPPQSSLTPEVMAQIDRMLAKVRGLLKENEDVQAVAALRIQEIQDWADRHNATRARQVAYLTTVLEYTAGELVYRPNSKSVTLPNGTLGKRAQGPRLVITEADKALAFCKKHGIEFKAVEEPYVGKLKEWALKNGKVPAGCTLETDRPDKPYIEVAK